jgi:hypothetical protein
MIIDPLKNSVTARNWDCHNQRWLGSEDDQEDGFTFPLFELREPGQ